MGEQIIANGGGVQYVPQIAMQYVYLDFDGELTAYNGEILTVDNVKVQDPELTGERIKNILAALNAKYAVQNVIFVTEKPTSAEYSTIYIGKTSAFDEYGTFAGVAETIDHGNENKSDNAFVMLDSCDSDEVIISTISHETDHLLGTLDHGGSGLAAYADEFFYNNTYTGVLTSRLELRLYFINYSSSYEGESSYYYYNKAQNVTVNKDGIMHFIGGCEAHNTIINSGGFMNIETGNTIFDTTINTGGEINLKGVVSNTTINGGLVRTIFGSAYHTSVNSGGELSLEDSCLTDDTTVNSGGKIQVSDGKATHTTINSGGEMLIVSKRERKPTVKSTVIKSGGLLCIDSGCNLTNLTDLTVEAGGIINHAIIFGETIHCTSATSSAIVFDNNAYFSGCKLVLSSGGVINNATIINSRGVIQIYGEANSTTVNSGGMILCNGETNNTTVNSGSMHIVDGTANNTIVNSGSLVRNYGVANSTTVKSGGTMMVLDGGIANNTIVSGALSMGGGSVNNTIVYAGALFGMGSANNTIISSGATLYLNDGFVKNTYVGAGGSMTLFDGKHTGTLELHNTIIAYHHSIIDFDITACRPADPFLINNFSLIQGSPAYTITVSLSENIGRYRLAKNAVNFNGTMSIGDGETVFGQLVANGDPLKYGGKLFRLECLSDDLTLSITRPRFSGAPQSISWDYKTNVVQYKVVFSNTGFSRVLQVTPLANNSIDIYNYSADDALSWEASGDGELLAQGDSTGFERDDQPNILVSNKDGNMDLFFAVKSDVWDEIYYAQHTGFMNGWQGTKEQVALGGKNNLADIFEGSNDANVLVMTDDENGDALFVDDIFTALPESVVKKRARISQIDEIRAGAGDDIVDMTSQKFAYAGDEMTIHGGLGDDTIWATGGDNDLFGDAGNDRIVGSVGFDLIVGGIGNDTMHTGGGGNDIFAFCENWGVDTVELTDADNSITLWFASGSASNWDAVNRIYSDGGNSVIVTGGDRCSIELKFGDEGGQYDDMLSVGAFAGATSEKIFEDKDSGMLA